MYTHTCFCYLQKKAYVWLLFCLPTKCDLFLFLECSIMAR